MLARIERSTSIRRTVRYNELKVDRKEALCLSAYNFGLDPDQLSLEDKIRRLKDLADRSSERVLKPTLHFSVNFHPSDELTDKQLRQIAIRFMKKAGIDQQPWLLYRHQDAGHPHVHIVTSSIRPDGIRINNDQLSPHHFVVYCRDIAQQYQLRQALPDGLTQHKVQNEPSRDLVDTDHLQRLKYGKTPTKTGIEKILDNVLEQYRYTSLEQLNAILRLYNVRAERGREQSFMYQQGGLYYRLLDDKGKKIGAMIKASSLNNRPTLKYLRQKFEENKIKITNDLTRIQNRIRLWLDTALDPKPPSLEIIARSLLKDQILMVIPATQLTRDLAFVDTRYKIAFTGADLGEKYTLASLRSLTHQYSQQINTLEQQQQLAQKQQYRLRPGR